MLSVVSGIPTRVTLLTILYISSQAASAAERSQYQIEAIEYSKQTITIPSGGVGVPESLQYTADLNQDGYTDIFMSGYTPVSTPRRGANEGLILLNNGDNTFTIAGGDRPKSEWAREVLVADFNGDNIPDVFVADHGWDTDPFPGFKNQLMLGTGDGFTDVTDRLPDIDDFSHNAAVGDIDKDGDVDIFVANTDIMPASEISYLLINDGSANFELNRTRLPTRMSAPNGSSVTLAADLADLDGDGAPELILGQEFDFGGQPYLSEVYWNDGAGNFSDAVKTELPEMANFKPADGSQIIDIQSYDIDGDQDKDLLLTANNNDPGFRGIGLQLFINEGGRQFVDRSLACLSGEIQLDSAERSKVFFFKFGDINFDGQDDIILESAYDNTDKSLIAFENTGGLKYRGITHHSLSSDQAVRDRFYGNIVLGNGVFGIAEIFPFEDNGQQAVGVNYMPITATSLSPIVNQFDSCTNKLYTSIDASTSGNFKLDFTIMQTSPAVIIQANAAAASPLTSLPDGSGAFDPSTGILTIPELVIDDQVAYTNVKFSLIDSTNLLFQLTGSD